MAQSARETAPWIFWPIAAVWDLLAFVVRLTGRIIGVLLGLALIVLAIPIGLTVVGLPLAIALLIVGFLLLWKSLF